MVLKRRNRKAIVLVAKKQDNFNYSFEVNYVLRKEKKRLKLNLTYRSL